MFQKGIRWKTGLSWVKTHLILLMLAKRGIVSAEKYYNTNRITLADWLTKETKPQYKNTRFSVTSQPICQGHAEIHKSWVFIVITLIFLFNDCFRTPLQHVSWKVFACP